MGSERCSNDGPMFETEKVNRAAFKVLAGSMLVGVVLIWVYRALQLVNGEMSGLQRCVWIGAFSAELWFGFYWTLTVSIRWNPTYRRTFKERLSHRYGGDMPKVDVFVCTADSQLEPPSMVVSTVLSVMAYDYPSEKLAIYLSDDGGSEITFYALWEASNFAKSWIPFCRRLGIITRSPANYFRESPERWSGDDKESHVIQKMYKEMEGRIDTATRLGTIPEEICEQHKGFSEWNSKITSRDHHAIVQILVDGRDGSARDGDGFPLPTLVYVAREKRPQHLHHFKAGAMNTLIRVSSAISNGPIILNVDCDMYSNNPDAVREALCFFMDEEKGDDIAYVQHPQSFYNITKNDLYANSLKQINMVDFHGLDGNGGPLYIGSCCFHRRHSLLGNEHTKGHNYRRDLWTTMDDHPQETTLALEEKAKCLSSCSFELDTQWGKQIGLRYGYPVEDVVTGLSILCNGWRSVYFSPERPAFLGLAPMTLAQTLLQHKRWSEGDLQVFMSKYCPFVCGHRKLKIGLQMSYSMYFLWALNSFPTLFYTVFPSLMLLTNAPLFPSVTSIWFVPFAYVMITKLAQTLHESMKCGLTLKAWWNDMRMWLFKRTTSYFFAAMDTFLKLTGHQSSTFVITSKVADEDVSHRYREEVMELGVDSPMLTILCTLALLNLLCFVGGAVRVVGGGGGELWVQLVLCGVVVVVNAPVFEGMWWRKDNGRVPLAVVRKGGALAVGICVLWIALWMV